MNRERVSGCDQMENSSVLFFRGRIHHYKQTFTKWEMSTQSHISRSKILILLLIFLKENRISGYYMG